MLSLNGSATAATAVSRSCRIIVASSPRPEHHGRRAHGAAAPPIRRQRPVTARLRRPVGGGRAGSGGAARSAAALPVVETDVDDQDAGRHLRRRVHPSGERRVSRRDRSGPTRSGCVPRCATWAAASPPTATRCSCRIRSTASAKAPVFEDASNVDFADPATTTKLRPLMGSIGAPGAAEKDAAAFVAFLDAQPQVDTHAKDRHAGLLHGRRAGRAHRGGGARPHRRRRVVPRRRARHRQARQPAPARAEDQGAHVLRRRRQRRRAAAGREGQAARVRSPRRSVPAEVEVYPARARLVRARHAEGERRADLRPRADAERAWAKLLALYRAGLA